MFKKILFFLFFVGLMVTSVMAQRHKKPQNVDFSNYIYYEEMTGLISEINELNERIRRANLRAASLENELVECRLSTIVTDTTQIEQIAQLKDQLIRANLRIAQLENESIDKISIPKSMDDIYISLLSLLQELHDKHTEVMRRISKMEYELYECRIAE